MAKFAKTSEQAIRTILENDQEINNLYFSVIYDSGEKAPKESKLIDDAKEKARRLKDQTSISFWQAFLSASPGLLNETNVIEEVRYHYGSGDEHCSIRRDDFILEGVANIPKVERTGSINFLSTVKTKTFGMSYIPLIDFRIKKSNKNKETCKSILYDMENLTEVPFVFTESRNSYHAFSCQNVSFRNYISILGRALLFDPIVDGRHIAHQLIDGKGALSVCGQANPGHP